MWHLMEPRTKDAGRGAVDARMHVVRECKAMAGERFVGVENTHGEA